MDHDDLRQALDELLKADPEIDNPNEEGPRPLSSMTSQSEGWCGFVEEKVTFYLKDRGFLVGYADLGSRSVVHFGIHYVTVVQMKGTGWVVVDFTAAQIPGFEMYQRDEPFRVFPVVANLHDYLDATGLELLAIKEVA